MFCCPVGKSVISTYFLYLGDTQAHGLPVCTSHNAVFGLPSWGDSAVAKYYKSVEVFCCDSSVSKSFQFINFINFIIIILY